MLTMSDIPLYWRKPLWVLLVMLVLFILFFKDSWSAMASIWYRSGTFAHGFLVVPASLWLLWIRRDSYRQLCPQPSYWGVLGVMIGGLLWLAANLVNVVVVEQFALVFVLVCLIWSILGNRVAVSMLFPLFFLFLMVPFGEDFVPFLVDFTANFVVYMLRLTGISVYQQQNYLTLTSGQWSVVEACSGIRYLIASITLGLVYAYLNYTSYIKRGLFIAISVFLPILANGMRAYLIVMIGHLSSMKLATGVDHLIYGWVFFGFVMLLLFYVGSFWQDQPNSHQNDIAQKTLETSLEGNSGYLFLSIISFAAIAIWPLAAVELSDRQSIQTSIPTNVLKNLPTDKNVSENMEWSPKFNGVMSESLSIKNFEGNLIGIYFANFGDESLGGELINSQNTILTPKQRKYWRALNSAKTIELKLNNIESLEETVLISDQLELLVWRWYRVGEVNTINRYYAKLLQLFKRLTGDNSPELMVVVYTTTPHGDYQQARNRLQKIALACCQKADI